ncbi:MAG: type II secretion system F family protein [Planctomycetota bacterium]
MPTFQYIAVDSRGREVAGKVEASDERAAISELRDRSLLVMDVGETLAASREKPEAASLLRGIGPIRERDRIIFLRQMALMVRSGLTLLQALRVCGNQTHRKALRASIERMANAIQSGQCFSSAMEESRAHFPSLAVKLVETAEATGELDPVLERIAADLENRAQVKSKLLTGMAYPAIVFTVSIGVAGFLVLRVIPKFSNFFSQRSIELPAMTRALLDLSAWIQMSWPFLLILLTTSLFTVALAYATPRGRLLLDGLLLKLPVIGRLLTLAAMSRFAQALAAMLGSGVTILESLRITRGLISNNAISRSLGQARERVLEGSDLSRSLASPAIPLLVRQVIGVGERSGALSDALSDLGKFYQRELEGNLQRMSAIVEPMMILIVVSMVGFVYIAFFQAIFQLVNR